MHLLNKLFSFFFSNTKFVSVNKKSLFVNYKKAIDRSLRVISLEGYREYSFFVEKETSAESKFLNNYKLILKTLSLEGVEQNTTLAHFELSAHASQALLETQNKLYSRGFTILKSTVITFVVFLLFVVMLDYVNIQVKRLSASYFGQTPQVVSQYNAQDVEALTKKIDAKIQEISKLDAQATQTAPGAAQPSAQAPGVTFSEGSPAAQDLLAGINAKK